MTYTEDSGCVERPQEKGEENKMSLGLVLIHMHQAQLGQLAHHILKMLGLWGPKRILVHKHRHSVHRLFNTIPLNTIFFIVLWLRETDLDRFLLRGVLSFYSLRVTHYLET